MYIYKELAVSFCPESLIRSQRSRVQKGLHIYIYIYIYTYIYIYIYIHTHIYTHIYTHVYTCKPLTVSFCPERLRKPTQSGSQGTEYIHKYINIQIQIQINTYTYKELTVSFRTERLIESQRSRAHKGLNTYINI